MCEFGKNGCPSNGHLFALQTKITGLPLMSDLVKQEKS